MTAQFEDKFKGRMKYKKQQQRIGDPLGGVLWTKTSGKK